MPETATLLVTCPDQKGLVSGISSFISRNGGNIVQSDQYTDVEPESSWRVSSFISPDSRFPRTRSSRNSIRSLSNLE